MPGETALGTAGTLADKGYPGRTVFQWRASPRVQEQATFPEKRFERTDKDCCSKEPDRARAHRRAKCV